MKIDNESTDVSCIDAERRYMHSYRVLLAMIACEGPDCQKRALAKSHPMPLLGCPVPQTMANRNVHLAPPHRPTHNASNPHLHDPVLAADSRVLIQAECRCHADAMGGSSVSRRPSRFGTDVATRRTAQTLRRSSLARRNYHRGHWQAATLMTSHDSRSHKSLHRRRLRIPHFADPDPSGGNQSELVPWIEFTPASVRPWDQTADRR